MSAFRQQPEGAHILGENTIPWKTSWQDVPFVDTRYQ
jgi:hypothetical protein